MYRNSHVSWILRKFSRIRVKYWIDLLEVVQWSVVKINYQQALQLKIYSKFTPNLPQIYARANFTQNLLQIHFLFISNDNLFKIYYIQNWLWIHSKSTQICLKYAQNSLKSTNNSPKIHREPFALLQTRVLTFMAAPRNSFLYFYHLRSRTTSRIKKASLKTTLTQCWDMVL